MRGDGAALRARPTGRIRQLDGLRGVAILLVLVWHYVACQLPVEVPVAWLAGFLGVTWSGVDLFFVLSGFLIVGNLLDAKGTPGYFRIFYVRRACRILPLYYLVLGLFVVLQQSWGAGNEWLLTPRLPLFSYFTFTQNFFMHQLGFGPNWLGVTWSLAVEEQFYLVVPLLVWALGRRSLAWVFGTAVVLAPVGRLAAGNLGAYVFPWARADAILLGGLIALLVRVAGGWALVAASRRMLVAALGVLLITVAFLVHKQAGVGDVYLHFVLALTFGVVLLLTLSGGGGTRQPRAGLAGAAFVRHISFSSAGQRAGAQLADGLVGACLGQSPRSSGAGADPGPAAGSQ